MEDTFLAIERYGFPIAAAVAMAVALYRIVMMMLVGRAAQFEESHKELHEMQIKVLERLTEIEKDFATMEAKLDIISEYVKNQMMKG